MTATSTTNVYESTFAKSDKTDAILVVEGKKLHVNKAFLSFHSDYFDKLFNADFKEKSMKEIPIKDVNFEDFVTLLSIVYLKPIKPTVENAERVLELAERFILPGAKPYLEMFLITTNINRLQKIRIGDKYELDNLIENGLSQYTKENNVHFDGNSKSFRGLSDKTKVKYLTRLLIAKQ